jgi:hypothetical protein
MWIAVACTVVGLSFNTGLRADDDSPADKAKDMITHIQENANNEKNDWDGYEKEAAGPTWDRYHAQNSVEMDAFLAPKTKAFVKSIDNQLHFLDDNDDYQAVKSDAGVKAAVAALKDKRDAAYNKLLKFATTVVDQADHASSPDPDDLRRLKVAISTTLGEDAPESLALQARVEKKVTNLETASANAEANRGKLDEMLRNKADEEWPKLSSALDATTDFDLSHPDRYAGKNIRFSARNLMGSRFNPDDFYFATTIDGIPVAARFAPALGRQIDLTEKALHRTLGDGPSDGKWDIIATVTDGKARLMQRRHVEASGTVDGADVKLKGETSTPVEAVVVQVIAAKCGPFCGAKDRGVLKEDGTMAR